MMKALVVDDNQFLASAILLALEREDFEVMSAHDGRAGYETYLSFRPDIVITDIQMPIENGFEMMRRIRNHDPMIKTIYISGDFSLFQAALEEEARSCPVSFFEKPFSLELLTNVIREWAPIPIYYPEEHSRYSAMSL